MNCSHVKRGGEGNQRGTMEKAAKSNLIVNDYLQGICLLQNQMMTHNSCSRSYPMR